MLQRSLRFYSLLIFFLVGYSCLFGQKQKVDLRPAIQKQDPFNQYQSGEITQLDLLHALDVAGIGIHKFDLGTFDKSYRVCLTADTYEAGQLVATDTFFNELNEYIFFERGETEYGVNYFDQLKVITQQNDNSSELRIHSYGFILKRKVTLKKWDDQQFYNWRAYRSTHWKINEKIPLMVYASSWRDKRHGFQRFCGAVVLDKDDEDTMILLQDSPTYVVISYHVSPVAK